MVDGDSYRAKILGLLEAGKVHETGRVTVDGRAAIRLASDDGGAVYGHVVTGRADRLLPPHMSVIQSYQSVPLLNRRCPDLQTEAQ